MEDFFDTWEVTVRERGRLVAASYFDCGERSVASLLGLYDRSYYQDEPTGGADPLFSGKSMVTILIVINVGVFFLNAFFGGRDDTIVRALQATPETIYQPTYFAVLV